MDSKSWSGSTLDCRMGLHVTCFQNLGRTNLAEPFFFCYTLRVCRTASTPIRIMQGRSYGIRPHHHPPMPPPSSTCHCGERVMSVRSKHGVDLPYPALQPLLLLLPAGSPRQPS